MCPHENFLGPAGDVIDVVLREEAHLKRVRVETGFDATEERAGNDRIISGQLLVSGATNNVDLVSVFYEFPFSAGNVFGQIFILGSI
jgi:hypothetical protein